MQVNVTMSYIKYWVWGAGGMGRALGRQRRRKLIRFYIQAQNVVIDGHGTLGLAVLVSAFILPHHQRRLYRCLGADPIMPGFSNGGFSTAALSMPPGTDGRCSSDIKLAGGLSGFGLGAPLVRFGGGRLGSHRANPSLGSHTGCHPGELQPQRLYEAALEQEADRPVRRIAGLPHASLK